MRVLVVDQDSALLTEITQTLGEYFTIDAVTNKGDCLDLVRVNDFDVIVAGERLQDGSGLELLGQLERTRPDMLRIFAIERERLRLLRGRLGPFGLFRTLSYPIEPRQLLAALSAAAGFDEEPLEESSSASEVPERPVLPTPTEVSAPKQPHAPPRPSSAPPTVTAARQATATAPMPSRANTSSSARPTRPKTQSQSISRVSGALSPPSHVPRRRTPVTPMLGTRGAGTSRPKGLPPPRMEPSARRSAFLFGIGVIIALGALASAFRLYKTSDEPAVHATLTAPSPPQFPPEVIKLVSDTETALQNDDLKGARTDIAALHQIAPTHPRLRFLEALLEQEETANGSSRSRSSARHTSSRKAASAGAPPAAPTVSSRRQTPAVATFSGRTIEEDSNPRSPADGHE